MRTLVLGGGVVGVTAAYVLARAGHECACGTARIVVAS